MGQKTLLQIVQAATGELQFSVPTTVLASDDLTVVQLKSLVVAACDELADTRDWQALLKTGFITTAATTSDYALPADYLRLLSDTTWDRTAMWPVAGAITPQAAQVLDSGLGYTLGPYSSFQIIGNQMHVIPVPGSANTLAFSYITRNYVIDGTLGTLKSEFTLDSDKTVFHDRCLINFVKLKLLQVKGFDTTAASQDFNGSLAAAMGGDIPAPTVRMIPKYASILQNETNVPQRVG